jgi:hypothetical protein
MTTENQNQISAATAGCAAAAGYADGRPKWDELCDCATICRTLQPKGMNESLEHFAARAEQTLRTAYEHGADWNYDADCPHCDTGRKHTSVLNQPTSHNSSP